MSWIKMRTCLPRTPEVYQIARETGLDRFAVVGRLLEVWGWFDTMTEDGNAVGVTLETLDDIACNAGFAQAMVNCGWLAEKDGKLIAPSFEKHNSETAKKRANTANRVARLRAKQQKEPRTGKSKAGKEPVTPPALPREEKRREEYVCVTHTTQDELPLIEPTTDEMAFDPWGTFERMTRISRESAIAFMGTLNAGAEIYTPESLAEAYIAALAGRDMRVYQRDNKGGLVSTMSFRNDADRFVHKVALANPADCKLKRKAEANAVNLTREPTWNWRKAGGILNGTGTNIGLSTTWEMIHRQRRAKILERGQDALAHPEKYLQKSTTV